MSKNEIKNSGRKSETAENFSEAVAALQRGDVIVYPTETLYGLGADALNNAAVERVFDLKGRGPDNPISVLVGNREMLHRVAEVPAMAEKLITVFWPGPLTLILPAREGIPKPLLNPRRGIGVRLSSHPIATRLVEAVRHPLTATSANPSGREPARTLAEARAYFAAKVSVYVDGGVLQSKSGSTVVEITAGAVKVIREGEISASRIERILGSETSPR